MSRGHVGVGQNHACRCTCGGVFGGQEGLGIVWRRWFMRECGTQLQAGEDQREPPACSHVRMQATSPETLLLPGISACLC